MSSTIVSLDASVARPALSTPVATLSAQITPIATTAGTAATSNREVQPTIVDRVDIKKTTVEEVQQAKKEKMEEENGRARKPVRGMNEILFAYNFRGDLRIQFMDSINRMVYQTPPALFARMSDTMIRVNSSVDMEV